MVRTVRFWLLTIVPIVLTSVFIGAATAQDDRLLERYERILLRNPVPGAAFDRYLQAYVDRGQVSQLRERLESRRQEAHHAWAATVLLAYVESRYGDADRAAELAQEAVKAQPDRWQGWLALATVMDRQRRYRAAADAYRRLLSLDGLPPLQRERAYRRLGSILAALGQLKEARSLWLQFAEEYADDQIVKEEVAEELAALGYAEDALSLYDALLREATSAYQKLRAAVGKAQLLASLDRVDDAVKQLSALLEELAPGSWYRGEALREIVTLYQAHGRRGEIKRFLERWRTEHPDDLDIALAAADVLATTGDMDEAIRQYEALRKRAPDDVRVARRLAQLYEQEGRYADARQVYEELAKKDSGNAELWEALGRCYWNDLSLSDSERRQKAIEAWSNIFTRRSDDALRAVRLAELLAAHGLDDEAERYYRIAVEKGTTFEFREYLAQFLHERGRTDDAVALLREALDEASPVEDYLRVANLLASFDARDALDELVEVIERRQPGDDVRWELGWLQLTAAVAANDAPAVRRFLEKLRPLLERVDARRRVSWVEELVRHSARTGDLEQELERWHAALTEEPTELTFAVVATLQLQLGQHDAMYRTLQDARRRFPRSAWLGELSLDLYRRVGRYDLAAETAGRLAEIRPAEASHWLAEQTRLLRRLGQYEEALQVAVRWRSLAPSDGEAHRAVIDLLRRLDRFRELDDAYRAAIQQAEDDPLLRLDYGKYLASAGRRVEAAEQFWQAFVLMDDEQRFSAIRSVYEAFGETGMEDEFIRRLEQWRADPERRIQGTLALARVYDTQARNELAEREYRRVLLDDPRNQFALERLINLEANRARHAQALAYAEQLLRLRPGDVLLEARIAQILLDLGRVEQAQARLEKILARSGDRAGQAARTLATRLHSRGYDEIALGLLEARLRRDPSDWRARLLTATILVSQEQDQQALPHLEKLLQLPWEPAPRRSAAQTRPAEQADEYTFWGSVPELRDQWMGRLVTGRVGYVSYTGVGTMWFGGYYYYSTMQLPDAPREGLVYAATMRLLVAEREGHLEQFVQQVAQRAGVELTIDPAMKPPTRVRRLRLAQFTADASAARMLMLTLLLLGQEQAILDLGRAAGSRAPGELAWLAAHITARRALRSEVAAVATPMRGVTLRGGFVPDAGPEACVRDGSYEQWLEVVRHSPHPESASPLALALADWYLKQGNSEHAARYIAWVLDEAAAPETRLRAAVFTLAHAGRLPASIVDRAMRTVPEAAEALRSQARLPLTMIGPFASVAERYAADLLTAIEELLKAGRSDAAAELGTVLTEMLLRSCWPPRSSRGWYYYYYLPELRVNVFNVSTEPIPPFPDRIPLQRYPDVGTLQQLWQTFEQRGEAERFEQRLAQNARKNVHSQPYLALAQAIRHARQGKLQDAATVLSEAVQQSGDNALRLVLAQVLANLGRHREAMEVVAQIGASWGPLYGLKWRALLRLGLLVGDEDTARGAAQRLARTTLVGDLEVQAFTAILLRLGLQRELGRFARRTAPSYLYAGSFGASGLMGQGRAQRLLAEGKRAAAIAVARRRLSQLARRPFNNERTAREPVTVLKNAGVLDEEIQRLKEKLQNQPSDFEALGQLYLIYSATGKQTEAQQLIRTALQQRPYDHALRYAWAVMLANQRRWDEAAKEFTVLLETAPHAIRDGRAVLDAFRHAGKLEQFRKLVENISLQSQFSIISKTASLTWLFNAARGLEYDDPDGALEMYRLALRSGAMRPSERSRVLLTALKTGKEREIERELARWIEWVKQEELGNEELPAIDQLFELSQESSFRGPSVIYSSPYGSGIFDRYDTLARRVFQSLRAAERSEAVEDMLRSLREADDSTRQLIGTLLTAHWLVTGSESDQEQAVRLMRTTLEKLAPHSVRRQRYALFAAVGLIEAVIDPAAADVSVGDDLYAVARWCEQALQQIRLFSDARLRAVTYAVLARYHAERNNRKEAQRYYRAVAEIRDRRVGGYERTLRATAPFLQWAVRDGVIEPVLQRLLIAIAGTESFSYTGESSMAEMLLRGIGSTPEGRKAIRALADRFWQELEQERVPARPKVEQLRALLMALGDSEQLYRLIRTVAQNPAFTIKPDDAGNYLGVLLAEGDDDIAVDLLIRMLSTLSPRGLSWPTQVTPRTPKFYRKVGQLLQQRLALMPVLGRYGGTWLIESWLSPAAPGLIWSPSFAKQLLEAYDGVLQVAAKGPWIRSRPGQPALSTQAALHHFHVLLWLGKRSEALDEALKLIGSSHPSRTLSPADLLHRVADTPFLGIVAGLATAEGRLQELIEVLERRAETDPLMKPAITYARFVAALTNGQSDEAARYAQRLEAELHAAPGVPAKYWEALVQGALLLSDDVLRTLKGKQVGRIEVLYPGRTDLRWAAELAALKGDIQTLQSMRADEQQRRNFFYPSRALSPVERLDYLLAYAERKRGNVLAAVGHLREALRAPSAGAYGRLRGVLLSFDPLALYVEILRELDEQARSKLEQTLRSELASALKADPPDAEPAFTLALLYLATDRAEEASQLLQSLPPNSIPASPFPLLAIATRTGDPRAIACVEECYLRWPWTFSESADALAQLYLVHDRPFPVSTERFEQMVATWRERAEAAGAQPQSGYAFVRPSGTMRVPPRSEQIERTGRFLEQLARALWNWPKRRREALQVLRAAQRLTRQPTTAIRSFAGVYAEPEAAVQLIGLALEAERLSRQPSAAAVRMLVSGDPRRLGLFLRRCREENRLEAIEQLVSAVGNETNAPAHQLMKALIACVKGEAQTVRNFVSNLPALLPPGVRAQERAEIRLRAVLALEAAAEGQLREDLLSAAVTSAVDLLRQARFSGGWLSGADAMLLLLEQLSTKAREGELSVVCRELVPLIRMRVSVDGELPFDDATFFQTVRRSRSPGLLARYLLEPAIEAVPPRVLRMHARLQRWLRWARAADGQSQSPGISLAFSFSSDGQVQLLWQVSPYFEPQPSLYETVHRPYGPAWLRWNRQPFVAPELATRPDGMTLVLETSTDGFHFERWQEFPATAGWDEKHAMGRATVRPEPGPSRWIRARLILEDQTLAVSVPIVLPSTKPLSPRWLTAAGGSMGNPLIEMPVSPRSAAGLEVAAQTAIHFTSGLLWTEIDQPVSSGDWLVVSWWSKPDRTLASRPGRFSGTVQAMGRGQSESFYLPRRFSTLVFEQRIFAPGRLRFLRTRIAYDRGHSGPLTYLPAAHCPLTVRFRPAMRGAVAVRVDLCRFDTRSIVMALSSDGESTEPVAASTQAASPVSARRNDE